MQSSSEVWVEQEMVLIAKEMLEALFQMETLVGLCLIPVDSKYIRTTKIIRQGVWDKVSRRYF